MEKTKKINKTYLVTFVAVGVLAIIACIVCYASMPFLKKTKGRASFDPTTWKYARYIKPDTLYSVTRVIDGDTMIVKVAGHDTTVRLIGIDTPETVDLRKPVGCYGHEASEKGKSMLSNHKVYLDKDALKGDYDKYGRSLVYLHLPVEMASSSTSTSSVFYNKFMLENGFAREYTFSGEPYKYQDEFKNAQDYARQAGLGLWASSTCNGK